MTADGAMIRGMAGVVKPPDCRRRWAIRRKWRSPGKNRGGWPRFRRTWGRDFMIRMWRSNRSPTFHCAEDWPPGPLAALIGTLLCPPWQGGLLRPQNRPPTEMAHTRKKSWRCRKVALWSIITKSGPSLHRGLFFGSGWVRSLPLAALIVSGDPKFLVRRNTDLGDRRDAVVGAARRVILQR